MDGFLFPPGKKLWQPHYAIDADGCWIWQRAVNGTRGVTRYKGKGWMSHVLSFALHKPRAFDAERRVYQTCDKPLCVNPEHLTQCQPATSVPSFPSNGFFLFPPGRMPYRPHYLLDATTGCWLWQRATNYGYGRVQYDGRVQPAHRVSFRLRFGHDALGDEQILLHRCHTPACVNPDHLQPGTPRENMWDRCDLLELLAAAA